MTKNQLPIGEANIVVFSKTLMDLAQNNKDLLVVTSDSRGSGKLTPFADKFPDQAIEIGIAEQNLVGVSAGLASSGKTVYAVSPASFLTARSLEQIKNDVAYSDKSVKLIGISAGVSYGTLGSTHYSIHDFAVLLAINNIDIVAPADNFETTQAIRAAEHHPRPIYIRMGKKPMPTLHSSETLFEIGKAIQVTPASDSYDVAFFATGETVYRAYYASQALDEQGINACVLSIHSLRPFDNKLITQIAEKSKIVITVEEHSVNGGLGSTVAALLMQSGVFRPLKIVGIPDEATVNGSQAEIFKHFGITPNALTNSALKLLRENSEK